MAKSKALVTDELWAVVEPRLPRRRRNPKGGRLWVLDRAALNGILFVLTTGIGSERLRQELDYGAGVTCWRRLRAWQRRGVWQRLHQAMLERLAGAGAIDWSRAAVDSCSLPARKGARTSARTRPTRASRGRSTMSSPTGGASHSPRL